MSEYIKSPLNYVGGKFKLLPQLMPLFPQNIGKFIDLFGGGGNISVNSNAETVIYNELNIKVVQVLEYFSKHTVCEMLEDIDGYIDYYQLSKTNRDGYVALREFYNNSEVKDPLVLYTLICYAFNNQIRFNSKGEYNMPFGKDRSSFNDALRQKFIDFCTAIQQKDIVFTNADFREYRDYGFSKNDFIYCDPPYFNSTATYNEKDGWTEKDENDLREMLCELSFKGIRFALSNNAACNTTLVGWAERNGFNVHCISANYSNCNYHKKDKGAADIEVLITNY